MVERRSLGSEQDVKRFAAASLAVSRRGADHSLRPRLVCATTLSSSDLLSSVQAFSLSTSHLRWAQ
jgi:hypothetical protein